MPSKEEPRFYDWNKALSYDADVTMVIGARGVGKTYGLRCQCVRDFLKDKSAFVEIVRYKSELQGVSSDYFSRIGTNNEFEGYVFKTDTKHAYIARACEEGSGSKPKWEIIGYFVALSQAQQIKKRTFDRVKRLIFDEAVLDKNDRYHHYLPNEFVTLANIVDTASRERADVDGVKPHLYLLGNALDILNPYFVTYKIGTKPKEGFSWHANKTMLLHYMKDSEYAQAKMTDTVAGRMLGATPDGLIAARNEFVRQSSDFVAQKPNRAKFAFGIVHDGNDFGIWLDATEGYYYVTNKIPKNTNGKPVFALTASDNKVNYIAARKAERALKGFTELYYLGIVRYQSAVIREKFIDALALFGVR